MSADEGREREVRDAPMNEEREERSSREPAPVQQHKCFVGGISWHLDDHKLREGERRGRSAGGSA